MNESGDGYMDEWEFENIFKGVDTWNSHNHCILRSMLRDGSPAKGTGNYNNTVDLHLAEKTFDKSALSKQQILMYPHFQQ